MTATITQIFSGTIVKGINWVSDSFSTTDLVGFIVTPNAPVGTFGIPASIELLIGGNFRSLGDTGAQVVYNRFYPVREEYRLMESDAHLRLFPTSEDANVTVSLIFASTTQQHQGTNNMIDWQVGDTILSMGPQDAPVQRWNRIWLPCSMWFSYRDDERLKPLFLLLWPYPDIWVGGGRGTSAPADWDSGKAMRIPDPYQRVLGLTSGSKLGRMEGQETFRLSINQMPRHSHPQTGKYSRDSNHSHGYSTGLSEAPNPAEGESGVAGDTKEVGGSEEISLVQPTAWIFRSLLICGSNPLS